jgi:hypothetical protein
VLYDYVSKVGVQLVMVPKVVTWKPVYAVYLGRDGTKILYHFIDSIP